MDALLSAAGLFALAAPVGFAAAWLVVKGPSGLAGLFGPQPGLGWPHGVQEEDPPSWNWSALDGTPAPAVVLDREGADAGQGPSGPRAWSGPAVRVKIRPGSTWRPH